MRKRLRAEVAVTDSASMSVAKRGMFIALPVYLSDHGDPKVNGHKVQKVKDPVSGKIIKAAFVPRDKEGYFAAGIKEE